MPKEQVGASGELGEGRPGVQQAGDQSCNWVGSRGMGGV